MKEMLVILGRSEIEGTYKIGECKRQRLGKAQPHDSDYHRWYRGNVFACSSYWGSLCIFWLCMGRLLLGTQIGPAHSGKWARTESRPVFFHAPSVRPAWYSTALRCLSMAVRVALLSGL